LSRQKFCPRHATPNAGPLSAPTPADKTAPVETTASGMQNLIFYYAACFSDSPKCRFMNGDKDLSEKIPQATFDNAVARKVPTTKRPANTGISKQKYLRTPADIGF
jgi:hypothetical protein